MASKKKSPSFEIPDAVRRAGQSGWVYRSGTTAMMAKTTRPSAPLPRPRRSDRVTAAVEVVVPAQVVPEPPQIAVTQPDIAAPPPVAAAPAPVAVGVSSAPADTGRSITGWLFGLGLQLAAVPFVLPLYLVSGSLCRTLTRS